MKFGSRGPELIDRSSSMKYGFQGTNRQKRYFQRLFCSKLNNSGLERLVSTKRTTDKDNVIL